mgnify:CR=1 FL=1
MHLAILASWKSWQKIKIILRIAAPKCCIASDQTLVIERYPVFG